MQVSTFAAIDIGSYDVTLEIFEISKKAGIKSIDTIRHRLELGTDTYTHGKLGPKMEEELCTVLKDFVRIMKGYRVESYRAIATSALREAENALEAMGLSHLAHRPYTDISGGERQQATVARAIVRHPKVVLFDEPTAHLDFGNQLRVLRMVRRLSEEGYATVVTTHNPDHAILLGGTAAVLDRQGCLRSGPAEELLTEELLRQIYDTQLLVRYNQELGRRVCLYPPL